MRNLCCTKFQIRTTKVNKHYYVLIAKNSFTVNSLKDLFIC